MPPLLPFIYRGRSSSDQYTHCSYFMQHSQPCFYAIAHGHTVGLLSITVVSWPSPLLVSNWGAEVTTSAKAVRWTDSRVPHTRLSFPHTNHGFCYSNILFISYHKLSLCVLFFMSFYWNWAVRAEAPWSPCTVLRVQSCCSFLACHFGHIPSRWLVLISACEV